MYSALLRVWTRRKVFLLDSRRGRTINNPFLILICIKSKVTRNLAIKENNQLLLEYLDNSTFLFSKISR